MSPFTLSTSAPPRKPTRVLDVMTHENVGNWYLIQSPDQECIIQVVRGEDHGIRLRSVVGNTVTHPSRYGVVCELHGSMTFYLPANPDHADLLTRALNRYRSK